MRTVTRLLLLAAAWLLASAASAQALRFGVLNQRSPQLTAQYWNPILDHVSRKSGVSPDLQIGKSAPDTTIMAEYAKRPNLRYIAVWASGRYLDSALMAHSRVPAATVEWLRAAFVALARDPEGQRVLEASARLITQRSRLRFVAADNRDDGNYRACYGTTLVQSQTP